MDRSSLTCFTRVQPQTTNSTVRHQSPAIIGYPDVQDVAASLDQGIPTLTSAFAARFKSVFPIPPVNQTTEKFSQAITSNLLGGIGYFYGPSIEDRGFTYEWDDEDGETENQGSKGPELTEPRELFTATPSRSFFPRGFYWCVLNPRYPQMFIVHRDEGFHLLHVGAWDNALSLEILKDWVNLVDADGWVGREQILGEEARSRVGISAVVLVPRPDVHPAGTERVSNPSPNLCESTYSRHGCHRLYRKAEGTFLRTH